MLLRFRPTGPGHACHNFASLRAQNRRLSKSAHRTHGAALVCRLGAPTAADHTLRRRGVPKQSPKTRVGRPRVPRTSGMRHASGARSPQQRRTAPARRCTALQRRFEGHGQWLPLRAAQVWGQPRRRPPEVSLALHSCFWRVCGLAMDGVDPRPHLGPSGGSGVCIHRGMSILIWAADMRRRLPGPAKALRTAPIKRKGARDRWDDSGFDTKPLLSGSGTQMFGFLRKVVASEGKQEDHARSLWSEGHSHVLALRRADFLDRSVSSCTGPLPDGRPEACSVRVRVQGQLRFAERSQSCKRSDQGAR